jgi:hypothetical protein
MNEIPRPGLPPPGYYYPPPYPPPVNVYAILSLVFAIAVFPPLGIYFGKTAQRQIAERGERGLELANAGVICGWIFTSFQVLLVLGMCGFVILSLALSGTSG